MAININQYWINRPVADQIARLALTPAQGVLVAQNSDDSLWQKTASGWNRIGNVVGVLGLSTVETAGSITTLTASSTQIQRCTGLNFQNYKLPDTSTLTLGYYFTIINESTFGSTTVYAGDDSTIIEIFPGRAVTLYVNSTGNAGASDWSYIYNSINWNPDQLEFVSGQLTIRQNYLASIWRLPLALCAETGSLPEGAPTATLMTMPVTDSSNVLLVKAFANADVTGDDVVINVYVNGSPLANVTIGEGQQFGEQSVEVAVSANDIITVDATVPTGAVASGVKVILFAGIPQAL